MIEVSSVSNGNGVHPHEDLHVKDAAGTEPGITQKTTAIYDQARDSRNLIAQTPAESEKDEEEYCIAKFMAEGLSEKVARAKYKFLR
jgi:cell fate regulator YaaT (PSP1 superfamily)